MHRAKRRKATSKTGPVKSGNGMRAVRAEGAHSAAVQQRPFFTPTRQGALTICLTGLVLLYMVWPVFGAFFIGEDLGARGLLLHNPVRQTWNAIAKPTSIFWRPAITLWFALSDSLLPLDPTAYHIRNIAATLACVVALYLLMAQLVEWVWARALGLAWFVVSKVHFTTVGCIEMIDSVATLLHVLLALYFFALYLRSDRKPHLWGSEVFFLLALCSRDYGIVLLPVMGVLAVVIMRSSSAFYWRRFFRRILPFTVIAFVYLGTRLFVFRGIHLPNSGNYSPRLDFARALAHAKTYTADLFNISFSEPWVHGSGSFASLFGLTPIRTWEMGFLLCAVVIGMATFAVALYKDARIWVGLCVAGAFIVPTFFVGLAHTYYMLTPMAGVALALAVAVGSWKTPARHVVAAIWAAVLAMCLLNGLAMRRTMDRLWWYTAGAAARNAYDSMIAKEKGQPTDSLTLLVADEGMAWYWKWVLDPFGGRGLVQVLADKPDLRFHVANPNAEGVRPHFGRGSRTYIVRNGLFSPVAPITIKSARPLKTKVGHGFNIQPGGESAMWLEMENATPGCVCMVGDRTFPASVNGSGAMSCSFPPAIYQKPARFRVHVEDRLTGLRSNSVEFTVSE